MQPDPQRVADTAAWLRRVEADLLAAEVDLAAQPPLLGDAAFHCQQAAEKALKACLTWHDRAFRKTHSLEELGEQCLAVDSTLKPLVDRAVPLTEYAWRFRYPGEPEEPAREEVEEALRLAREVDTAVRARLPREVGTQ
jgi:HEPN domain-containing protein